MSEDWLGCRVSLDCGSLGYFQGVISRINLSDQTVTLEKPFQNGLSCKVPELTLNATDIEDLKILKSKEQLKSEAAAASTTGSSVVQVVKKKSKNAQQPPIAEQTTIQGGKQGNKNNKVQSFLAGGALINNRASPRHYSGARASPRYDRGQGTPTRYRDRARDDEFFGLQGRGGSALNEEEKKMIEQDFDFEANLAMFDKDREMREIEADLMSNKPDIVRLVHSNVRQPEPKYKSDENVLGGGVVTDYRQIITGEEEVGDRQFVTDSGLIVPSVSLQLRDRLASTIISHGISIERQAEMIGRATTELAIHLLGGQHRLNPSNMHQVPTAVFLCGTSLISSYGLAAARHLASHGVKSQVFLPDAAKYPANVEAELKLYRLTGGKVVTRASQLPTSTVDLIVTALEDQEMWSQERCQPWHRAATAWAQESRAPVLAVDPPPITPTLDIKMSLTWGLPLSHSPQSGKLYLVNLGIPKNIYKEVGIKFSSPFGAKFVIPLHDA